MNQVGLEIHVDAPSGREIRPSRIGRGVFSSRVHSRSASWSFTGSQAPRGPSDLGSSLAAINPLTSVIRELVPSYGQNAESTGSIGTGSRNSSQGSLHRGPSYDEELSNSPRTQESGVVTDAPPIEAEEQNIGTEIGDGVRWLEQNAIFFVLLLVKFAWFHRSGVCLCMCSTMFTLASHDSMLQYKQEASQLTWDSLHVGLTRLTHVALMQCAVNFKLLSYLDSSDFCVCVRSNFPSSAMSKMFDDIIGRMRILELRKQKCRRGSDVGS